MIGLCCTVLFPGISHFLWFRATATVISRFNFFVSGYFVQFPDYHHHTAATNTFSGWAYFVTLGSPNFGFAVPLNYHFDFVLHPTGGPAKSF